MNRCHPDFVTVGDPPVPVTVSVSLTFSVPAEDASESIAILFAEVRRMLVLYRESGNLVYHPTPVVLSGYSAAMKGGAE